MNVNEIKKYIVGFLVGFSVGVLSACIIFVKLLSKKI